MMTICLFRSTIPSFSTGLSVSSFTFITFFQKIIDRNKSYSREYTYPVEYAPLSLIRPFYYNISTLNKPFIRQFREKFRISQQILSGNFIYYYQKPLAERIGYLSKAGFVLQSPQSTLLNIKSLSLTSLKSAEQGKNKK